MKRLMLLAVFLVLGIAAHAQFNQITAGPPTHCNPNTLILDAANNNVWSCGAGTLTTPPTPKLVTGAEGAGFGIDATSPSCLGLDPSLQIQYCIYTFGGLINATNFTDAEMQTFTVNPFQTPGQSNPTMTTGLPAGGLLLLPCASIAVNVPFLDPNKWQTRGCPGYGPYPNKTTIQPSATFLANRPQIGAVGTGSTGLSCTSGSTCTITGTTLPAAANLEGMFLLGSSNASATAIPDSTNAQIVGCIINASGSTLTLSGAQAPGTVSDAGWQIVPVIAGWMCGSQGYAVQGGAIEDLVISAATPGGASFVNPSICWLDISGQEDSSLTRFGADYCNFIQVALFTSGAQNGGPFTDLTLNTKGQGTNNSILVQLFGTGPNAAGGGVSGLCSPTNPCSGSSTRPWIGLTLLCDGTGGGTGCTGMDVSAIDTTIGDGISHCEGCNVGIRIGYSGAAKGIKVAGFAGSSASGSALTSAVDIALPYCTAPGPTQNITLMNLEQGNGNTFNFRNFCDLTSDINDPTVGLYTWGAQGNSFTQVFSNTQPLSCINSNGTLNTNGNGCHANSRVIVSVLNGKYFCDGYNNDGTKDAGQQISNCLQVAYSDGLTQGVYADASGFNKTSGTPIGVCPWAGTIPASGTLELGFGAYFFSTGCTNPANWKLKGQTPFGLGAGGATGTTLAPNINNTVNANFANDTTTGTISCTQGSQTVTGAGTNFSSAWVNRDVIKGCATLPCTTQATMCGGIVQAVASTTSMTLAEPAQANLSGGAYTATQTLLTTLGAVENIAIDSNGFGQAAGVTGGFAGLGIIGQNIYAENITVSHVPDIGIWASGLNAGNLLRGVVSITANGNPSSIFCGICIPQGLSVEQAQVQTNTTTLPALGYGVFAGGTDFTLQNILADDVPIALELFSPASYVTNGVHVIGVRTDGGTAAATTLVDLAGVTTAGANQNAFAVELHRMIGGGSTDIVNDHINSYTALTATDGELNNYEVGKQVAGCRFFRFDGHTTGIPTQSTCGNVSVGGSLILNTTTILSGAGAPTGNCPNGLPALYLNSTAGSASTFAYVCFPPSTWTAITVP